MGTSFRIHDRPVGWAVIGLGMGLWHARYISKSPGLRLVALCDSDAKRLAEQAKQFPGVRTYSSVDAVLKDPEVEGVSLVLPHDMHASMAIRFLKSGRHVVVDKPFCLTVAEGRRMIAVARVKRLLLSVFHNRRWDADYVAIQRAVDKGAIGKVRYLESRISGAGRLREGTWRADRRQMGGLLYDWCAHLIDQALHLIPARPVSVYGFAQRDIPTKAGFDVEDRMHALIHFADGATALVAWAMNSPAPMPRFLLEGERGGIRSQNAVHSSEKPKGKEGVELITPGADGKMATRIVPLAQVDWSAYYRNIGSALRGREPLAVTPEEALRPVAVAEAAYQSVRTGRPVRLPIDVF
jgi:scyllo-inositol 2-dehydrogenase (NADP+)